MVKLFNQKTTIQIIKCILKFTDRKNQISKIGGGNLQFRNHIAKLPPFSTSTTRNGGTKN